ncbi:MAG: threonine synthase [Pseudomonadota bacterium]
MMMYRSTRGSSPVSLDTALVQGLAPDGGLFVPEVLPKHTLDGWEGLEPWQVAARYLEPFFDGSQLRPSIDQIAQETFAFDLPLREFEVVEGKASVLELFHGPTAAFKDVGARFLAACLQRLQPSDAKTLTILVATSGDTGGAVAAAFHRRPGIRVVVLFPEGRVSARQQHQLTCWGDNVVALSVQGSFDDCQRLVKAAFVDDELASTFNFSSANSINIGRLLPQSAYYAYASLQHFERTGKRLSFVVPTGNLGNGLAAVLARACGMPIDQIRFVTNANRTLPDYFSTGEYRPRDSIPTLASAMDVGAPSNLERLTQVFGEAETLRTQGISVDTVDDETISTRVEQDAQRLPFVWCPHSATGMASWLRMDDETRKTKDWCLVATAHPAKFETIVEPLIGRSVEVPPALSDLLSRPTEFEMIAPTIDAFRGSLSKLSESGDG